jgi:FkbM family methyltransferase
VTPAANGLIRIADEANAYVRSRPRLASLVHAATQPVRRRGLPVLMGPGQGLRLSVGDSTLLRVVSRVEKDSENVMLAHLRPGDAVWDVGANIGWFSLLAARAVWHAGAVTAFEPSATNAGWLERNAARNRLQITVVRAAVSDVRGWARFDASTSLGGHLTSSGRDVVPTVTLDSWAGEHGPPSFVKIDVEGAEVSVLTGGKRLLSSGRPVILCEAHGTQTEIAAVLREHGYEVRAIEMPGVPVEDMPGWVHLLGLPGGI